MFVLLAVTVLALNDGIYREDVKALQAEKALLDKPSIKSSLSDTPQGQKYEAEILAKEAMIADLEAKMAQEQMLQMEAQQQFEEAMTSVKEEWRPGKDPVVTKSMSVDGKRAAFMTSHPTIKRSPGSIFLTEDFEGIDFPPAGWDTLNTDPGYGFFQTTFTGGGTQGAFVTWHAPGFTQDEWLLTPALDVSSSSAADLKLEFWMLQGYTYPHDFNIHVSTDGGSSWTLFWNSLSVPYPEHEWYFVSLDISAYASETNLMFGFQYYGIDADLFGLDDITVNDDIYVAPTGRCCSGDPFAPTCDDGMTEADCITLGGTWSEGLNCVDNPCPIPGGNDECANAEPITGPYPQTVSGTTVGATIDCPGDPDIGDWDAVWYSIDLPYAVNDVSVDYCGTLVSPPTISATLFTACTCDPADQIYFDAGSYYDCGDGVSVPLISWDNVAGPGTVYYAVWTGSEKARGQQDFTFTVSVSEPPPAPANDDCANAEEIGDVVDFAFSTETATNDGAGYTTGPNIWYVYTASCDGVATVSLCNSFYDTKIAAYDGNDCGLTTLLASNDDECGDDGYKSEISFPVVSGQEYLLEVGGYSTGSAGDGLMTISCGIPDPGEPGDNCLDPLKIDIPTLPYGDYSQTTCGRVDDYDATCMGFYDGGEDIVYEVTVSSAVDVNITLDTKGESYGGIGLFDLCPSDPGASCIDIATGSSGPYVMNCVHLEPGTYYIMVDSWPSPDCLADFDLIIEAAEGCDAPDNDDCDKATVIGDVTELPYSTELATFDGPGACQTAANVWFEYTATCDGFATISTSGSDYDTRIAVYDGSCAGAELGCDDDGGTGVDSELEIPVYAGQVLVIELGGYSSNTGNGVLTTFCSAPCEITIPAGAVDEGEPCGSDVNGGCNSVPEAFGTAVCGGIVSGNAWADLSSRDTDWFELEVTECSEITLTGSAEFDFILGFVETGTPGSPDCATASALSPYVSGLECETQSVSMSVNPGTYWIFVGPSVYEGYPCANGPFEYYFEVECTSVECSACAASGGCDEYISNVTVGDINNSSACDGYADYRSLSTLMEPGTGYPISVENGNAYSSDDCGIWVDWNADLDFDDPDERIVMDVETGYGPYSATITPPEGTSAGDKTMRVRIAYSGVAADMSPCGSTTYGEVEDYTITVGIPIAYVPVPGTVYTLQKFHLEDDWFDVYMGTAAIDGADVNDLSNVTIAVGGFNVPCVNTVIPGGFAGMSGDVLQIRMDVADYIGACELNNGGLLWGTVDSFFDIAYDLSGTPGTFSGQVVVVGHTPGDFTLDGTVDITDLVQMVGYMFQGEEAPTVPEVADVDGSKVLDIGDVVRMVEFMFNGGTPLTHP
ncbi:MAG: hypothetical protein DWP97_00895 [Calditrichaeota bacterium]|nr:MAG: hypothetical protein DWP97_00895 [Calditrichota bacterium]